MMHLIKKHWINEKGLNDISIPIFELGIIFEFLIGILIVFTLNLLNDLEFITTSIILSYLFWGYRGKELINNINKAPIIYKNNNDIFVRYIINIFLYFNDLVPVFLTIITCSILFGYKKYIFLLYTFIAILTIILSCSVKKIYMILLVIILTFLNIYLFLNNTIFYIVGPISLLIFIYLLSVIPNEIRQKEMKAINYKSNYNNLFLNLLIRVIKYYKSNFIIYFIVLFLYILVSTKFNFNSSILPFFAFIILFEAEVFMHLIINNNNYSSGRVLWLETERNLIVKVLASNFVIRIIPIVALILIFTPYILILGVSNIFQILFLYFWIGFLIFYLARLEIKSVVSKRIRPSFAEEYVILIINVGMVFIL